MGLSLEAEIDSVVAKAHTSRRAIHHPLPRSLCAPVTESSPDETTGVLEIKIQAASVDTGNDIKNGKLKGKDFFDVEQNPLITFVSIKFVQTGPDTFEVDGDFTIRGGSNSENLRGTAKGQARARLKDRWFSTAEQRHPLHQNRQSCRRRFPLQREASQRAPLAFKQ